MIHSFMIICYHGDSITHTHAHTHFCQVKRVKRHLDFFVCFLSPGQQTHRWRLVFNESEKSKQCVCVCVCWIFPQVPDELHNKHRLTLLSESDSSCSRSNWSHINCNNLPSRRRHVSGSRQRNSCLCAGDGRQLWRFVRYSRVQKHWKFDINTQNWK